MFSSIASLLDVIGQFTKMRQRKSNMIQDSSQYGQCCSQIFRIDDVHWHSSFLTHGKAELQ